MQLAPSPAELSLRDEIRAFLAQHQPDAADIPTDFDARVAFLRDWQRRLHEAGLVGLSWPAEYGGRGASLSEQIVANAAFAEAGAPTIIGSVGLDVVGPSLVDHGTPEQKERFLERILSCCGHLVPGVLRGRCRLRPRRPEDQGRPAGRAVRHLRP